MRTPRLIVLALMLGSSLTLAHADTIQPTLTGGLRQDPNGGAIYALDFISAVAVHPERLWPYEDRGFIYFDAHALMAGRVTLDMYARQQSEWDSTCAGSKLWARPYSHPTATITEYDWWLAQYRYSDTYGDLEATPDGVVRHWQLDVTEAAHATNGQGFLCIALVAQGRTRWDTGPVARLPNPTLIVDGAVAVRSISWGELKRRFR